MDSTTLGLNADVTLSSLPFGSTAINPLSPTSQPVFASLGFSDRDTHSKAVSRRAVRLSTRGTRQRLIGGLGNDTLDASRGRGKNILKGNAGNDRLVAGQSDRLFGDAGIDTLDARRGRGGNTLLGGAGNDTIYTKTRDTADGGAGDDILWAGLGDNQLTGGQGADQFWIANGTLPTSINTIRDFQVGIDTIKVSGIPGVTGLSDLALTQQGANTLISLQGRAIALLAGVTIPPPPPIPTISTSNISVSERDTGTTTVAVDVTLSAASTTPITVNYQSVAGTATTNEDFTPVSGTLTFAPGETTKAIAVNIIGDTRDEFDETLSIALSNPTGATLGNSQAQVTILDNDTTTISANGVQSDGSKLDGFSTGYQFDLYDITPLGDYRLDEDSNPNNDTGVFTNAIENFTGYISESSSNRFLGFDYLKIGGQLNVVEEGDVFIPEALTLDLRAKFIPRGSTITLPNGEGETIRKDRVEYTLTNSRLRNEAGFFAWTFVLEGALIEEAIIDIVKAVNSIEYIVANQLLAKADLLLLTGTSTDNPQGLYTREVSLDSRDGGVDKGSETSPLRIVTRSTPVTIPRPTSYNAVVAPTNDTIAHATDTGLSSNGIRRFKLSSQIGTISFDEFVDTSTKDVDLFRVQLNAGESVAISTKEFSYDTVDTILRVFDSNGNQLAFNDNYSFSDQPYGSEDAFIEFRASVSGSYYVGVSRAGNAAYNPLITNSGAFTESGGYDLEITILEPNNTIANAIDTELYTVFDPSYEVLTRIGDIAANASLDIDFYKVQLNAGDRLTIDIDTDGFAPGIDILEDSYLRLFSANGTVLDYSDDDDAPDDSSSNSLDSYIDYRATTAGIYYIGVSGYGNSSYDPLTGLNGTAGRTGYYTLTVNRTT